MGKISKEWHDARLDVLDEFWDNKIDFEGFKKKIGEVDAQYKPLATPKLDTKADKYDPDYLSYQTLKYDNEQTKLPAFKIIELEKLKKKFGD